MPEPTAPTTLRAISGLPTEPAPLSRSALVVIDAQNTYTRGVLELEGVQGALDRIEELLDRARTARIPVVHVQHDAGPGSPYDVRGESGAIVPRVAPRDGEAVVVKAFPDSFEQTELDGLLEAAGAHDLLLTGFMTHMCVSSTARGAFNRGYAPTVVAAATATRALPFAPGTEEVVPAGTVHAASLAAVADLFGLVVPDSAAVPD